MSDYDVFGRATLKERLRVIRDTIAGNGEEQFYISFSGGRDSTVLSHLIDMAIPNEIPRVFVDTGIEFNMLRDFVYETKEKDARVEIVKPTIKIKTLLEEVGYPFKSKGHASMVDRYQRKGFTKSTLQYLGRLDYKEPWSSQKSCPKKLEYQFTEEYTKNGLRISDRCCTELKEKPIAKWAKENNKKISILGIMREEGGRRSSAKCFRTLNDKLISFHPMAPLSKEWEEWFIRTYNIELCKIYYDPYNLPRTGCKGCPFAVHLQAELEMMADKLPNERKQCEDIWRPVYEEYRAKGYRLKEVRK